MLSGLCLAVWLAAAPAPVQVTDAAGRTVTLPSPPRRIAVAGRAGFMISDAAYAFPGARERLVAVGRASQGEQGIAPIVDPGYSAKAIFERETSAEQVAAARPDLVLLKRFLADRMAGPLAALGIPVVFLDLETPDDFPRDLTTLGKVLGDEPRARDLVRALEERRRRVESAVAGVPEKSRPSVLLLYRRQREGTVAFNVPPECWMQTALVRMAGGRPCWLGASPGKGWAMVGFEQIAAWDPDRVFVTAYADEAREAVEEMKKDPRWRGLRAVREGRIEPFAGDLHGWDQPTVRWVLGALWLASRLHPDRFPGLDVEAEVRAFHREVYGLDEATFRRTIEPRLTGKQR